MSHLAGRKTLAAYFALIFAGRRLRLTRKPAVASTVLFATRRANALIAGKERQPLFLRGRFAAKQAGELREHAENRWPIPSDTQATRRDTILD